MAQLEQPFDGPTIVVTHHLPALTSIVTRYAADPHKLFQTRIACNPRGYPGEHGHVGFKPDLTIDA